MRWIVVGVLLCAPLVVAAPPATAQQNTGNWLLEGCRSQMQNKGASNPVQAEACIGGVRSVLVVGAANNDICAPQGMTEEQAIPIILRYVDAHPMKPGDMAGQVAYDALKAEWPCR